MDLRARSSFFMGFVFLIVSAVSWAQTTYEDPQGRFAIDIPKGWQLAPQADDKVFVFQGEGKSIIIECIPMVNDPAEIFKKAETTVRLSGMANSTLEGEVTEMTVNGLPARWGIYKGVMAGVMLAALCGGVANGENGLYFLSFIPVTDMTAWKDQLEKTFQTIRGSSQKITGVEGAKAVGWAQTTYEDPQGRFAIDIPKGWQLAPQTDDKVFVFQGEGKTIIIECVPMVNDPAELLKKAETTVRLSGMAKPALDGDITKMTLNGLPARWSIYKGALSGMMFTALCGGVANGENGLYFLSLVLVTDIPAWKDKLEKTLQTIRGQGQKVTGVENVKTVTAGAAAAGNPTPWRTELVSLTLPPDWVEKPKLRGFEKEFQGWFKNDALPDASLIVVCYKGMGMTLGKAFDAGIKTITIPAPGMKPVEVEEIKLPNGKINFIVLRGMVAASGSEYEAASVVISCKAKKCYTNLILTGLWTLLPELKSQALEIAKTVK